MSKEDKGMTIDFEVARQLSRIKDQSLKALNEIRGTAKNAPTTQYGVTVIESPMPNILLVDWHGIKVYFRAAHNASHGVIEHGTWQVDMQGHKILSPKGSWELYKPLKNGGSSPSDLLLEILDRAVSGEYEKEPLFYI
jgi:hypothetical protein